MTYVGIEGSSYVGKTTVAECLGQRGFLIIPEYDTSGPFPVSDGTDEGMLWLIDHLFERERRRTEQLLGKRGVLHVFADRTPLSFITFEDMKIATLDKKEEIETHRRARDYAVAKLSAEVRHGNIMPPEAFAILRLSSRQEFKARVHARGITPVAELANFDTQRHIADRANVYANDLVGQEATLEINVDGLETEGLADAIQLFADRLSTSAGEPL